MKKISSFWVVLQKLYNSHPFYTNRLKKELAAVEVQLKGDQLTAVKQKLQWMYGLSIFLSLLAALFFVLWIRAKRNSTTEIASDLTTQEQKIEELIVKGLSNKEIGDELFISLSTVKTHINTLYKKRGVRSRQELIKKKSTGV
ncbi:MAG: LuxR C-terminal-related transcriptional regulator [Saprospiraceae bacterium]